MNEFLSFDLSLLIANARRETIGGREYVVGDATILRQQVLHGSDGPLFYSLNEISKDIGGWNGFPLTAKHPSVTLPDGKVVNASARSPKVAHAYQIGTVYNDRMVGEERKVEVWFDIQNSNRIDKRIVPAVEAGKQINVSTGLFLTKQKVAGGGFFNGNPYTHTVHNLKPDHLAVLMDEKGACSVDDGCGINIRNSSPDGDPTVNKEQLVTWLVTNCECWKGDASKTTLNTLDEKQLNELKSNAEKAKVADPLSEIVKNLATKVGFKDTDPRKLTDFVVNSFAEKDKAVEDAKKAATPPAPPTPGTLTKEQVINALSGLTGQERVDLLAPAGSKERQFIDTAKQVHEERRLDAMKKLVANEKDDEKKKSKLLRLKDKSLAELNELLDLVGNAVAPVPTEDETVIFLKNFFGAQGGDNPLPAGASVVNKKEVLLPFTDPDELLTNVG